MTIKLMDMKFALGHIAEWRPPDFQELDFLLIYVIAIFLAMTGLGLRLRGPRLIAFGLAMLVGFRYFRGLVMFLLLLPFILARPSSARIPFFALKSSAPRTLENERSLDPIVGFLRKRSGAILALCAFVAFLITVSAWWRDDLVPAKRNSPEAAIDFVRSTNIAGNVFNGYSFGGFLIFSEIPTFIDGRTELYGDDFYHKYYDTLNLLGSGNAFELLDGYKVNWVLLRPTDPLAKALARNTAWEQVYSDEYAVVIIRRQKSTECKNRLNSLDTTNPSAHGLFHSGP
jgi:hypothetical protein